MSKLVHAESGQYQASFAVIPFAKADPQAMASAFTYGRPYALSSMLGIICEEDDDGNAASYGKNIPKSKNGKAFAKAHKALEPNKRVPLSKMLIDHGLEDLLPCYKQYLRSEYGCTSDKIPIEQYEEQRNMLEKYKKEGWL